MGLFNRAPSLRSLILQLMKDQQTMGDVLGAQLSNLQNADNALKAEVGTVVTTLGAQNAQIAQLLANGTPSQADLDQIKAITDDQGAMLQSLQSAVGGGTNGGTNAQTGSTVTGGAGTTTGTTTGTTAGA